MDAPAARARELVELLKGQIARRQYTVGVIGLGYVGLPLVLRFAEAGFTVLGFDIDGKKVTTLNAGGSYIRQIGPERVEPLILAAPRKRR